jgi:hypothetical protein
LFRAARSDYDGGMDLFTGIGENSILDLIVALLLMALWAGAIVAIDRWVWSDRYPASRSPR